MTANLTGKRVLVIGGETALGRAVAVGLAELGAHIAITSLTAETKAEFAINSALNELWAMGRKGIATAIDASDPAQVRAAVERAEAEVGNIDLAVVASPDATQIALDTLGRAMIGISVVTLAADLNEQDAMRAVQEWLKERSS